MTKGKMIDAIYKANLTKRATLVVFYLINRSNKEMTCFPGIKTIAKECNVSTRTVQRALNDLIEAGFLKKESRFHEQGGQRSNLYTLTIAEKECDNTSDDTVTFDSYITDTADKKEEGIDEIEFNNEDICPKEQTLDKVEHQMIYNSNDSTNSVVETYLAKSNGHSIDYCRGG